jgi:catechol 2,3-dioxygenase-like lactoylglutathione lyase family enzyme
MKKLTTKLSSIIIFCRQLDRMTGFYSEVLGLKAIKQSNNLS